MILRQIKTKFSSSPGFGLIDSMVAIGLVAASLLVLVALAPTSKLSRSSGNKLNASFIAQRQLEVLKTTGFANLANQSQTNFSDPLLSQLNDGSANYTIADYDADNDGTPETDIKKITVTVNWTQNGLTQAYSLSSLIGQTGLFR